MSEIAKLRAERDAANRARNAVVILLRAKTDDATWAAYPDCIKDAVDAEYATLRQRAERTEGECARLRAALVKSHRLFASMSKSLMPHDAEFGETIEGFDVTEAALDAAPPSAPQEPRA